MQRKLIPDYLMKLQTYKAGKPIEELAREKGITHISKLASNENPLGPSPFAIKEMTSALWDIHRYPDMHATELKNSLCELYNLLPENIILGNGASELIDLIIRSISGDTWKPGKSTEKPVHQLGNPGKIVLNQH